MDGEMSISQRQAVITLIEKKGKDKRYIQNGRPISLINVDAKVASKCLALRLKKFIHTLVDSHQTAYVPGCNIGESVRLAEDLLKYAEKEDLTGIMFSLDFEKHLILLTTALCSHVLKGLDLEPNSFRRCLRGRKVV